MISIDIFNYLLEFLVFREVEMPKVNYMWNETNVDLMVEHLSDDEHSPERRDSNIGKIYHFLEKIGAKGIGKKTVAKMYDNGLDRLIYFFVLEVEDLEFFGDKTALNIVSSIKSALKTITLPLLLGASCLFGRLIGVTRFTSILEVHPDLLTMDIVVNNDVEAIVEMIQEIDGFAETTARTVAEGFEKFFTFAEELNEIDFKIPIYEKPKAVIKTADNELHGKNVLLTGFRSKEITEFLIGVGAIIQKNINKKTEILIIKNASYTNTKTTKAEENGAEIIAQDDLREKYM